jgi:hypothetical protein
MLREWQEKFARALYEEEPGGPAALSLLEGLDPLPHLAAQESLDLYRNSLANAMEESLAEIFPVCAELVGEKCFRSVALLYLRNHPSRQADLARVGDGWPEFVESLTFLSDLPYLADVGRLELALHHAHAAPWPTPSTDPQALGEAIAQDPEAWRLLLSPSATLLASPHPVLTLWEAHQDRRVDRGWTLDPAAPGEHIFVCRQGSEIYADLVEPSLWPILLSISSGQSVARQLALAEGLRVSAREVPAEALSAENSMPILTTIQALFERGWVVGGLPVESTE